MRLEKIMLTANKSYPAWRICIITALFPFYAFFQMNMLNVMSNELCQTFAMNAAELGLLSSLYFYANSLLLLPAGILLDFYAPRILILLSLVLIIAGTFLIAAAHAVEHIAIGRFITGMGHAFALISSFKIASRLFTSSQLAFAMGLIFTIALLGGVVAQVPMSLLSNSFGWRKALFIDGGIGIIILAAIIYTLNSLPSVMLDHDVGSGNRDPKYLLSDLKLISLNANNWFCSLHAGLLSLSVSILGALWGTAYLKESRHLGIIQASTVTTMIFIGLIIGSPFAGSISDRMQSRKKTMLVGSIISLFTISIILYQPQLAFSQLLVLFFFFGFFTSVQSLCFPAIAEINPKELVGTALGFCSIVVMLSEAISQTLFGWLMDYGNTLSHFDTTSLTHNYTYAVLLLPLSFILSIIAVMFFKDSLKR
jgi:MFS family permease